MVAFLTLLAVLYFLACPLLNLTFCPTSLHVTKITNLNDLRNYYIVIGTISGTVTALIGVGLGFFYYFHKARVDKQQLQEYKRTRLLESLLSEINDYDVLVDKILNREFQNQNELQMLRGKIRRKFEMVYLIVEEKNGTLEFSRNSRIDLFDVNKYVDDSQLIMEKEYKEIKISDELSECREEYTDKIIKSRRVCLGA